MKIENLSLHWPWITSLLIGAVLGAALGYFGQCTSGTCPLTSTWWRGAIYGGVMGLLFAASSPSRAVKAQKIDRSSEVQPSGQRDPKPDPH